MLPIKRVLDGIEKVQSLLTNVFFVVTIVVVSFQAVNRFWFKLPIMWTVDLADGLYDLQHAHNIATGANE